MGISYRKRENTPKYNVKQQLRSTKLRDKLAKKLYRTVCSVIVDIDMYSTFACDNMPGYAGYYTANKSTCPKEVRFTGKEKFSNKILMFIAMSDRELSAPPSRPFSSVAVNSAIYINEYLEIRLLTPYSQASPGLRICLLARFSVRPLLQGLQILDRKKR